MDLLMPLRIPLSREHFPTLRAGKRLLAIMCPDMVLQDIPPRKRLGTNLTRVFCLGDFSPVYIRKTVAEITVCRVVFLFVRREVVV